MLKAFSLGSLSHLTIHQRLRKCSSRPTKYTYTPSKSFCRSRHSSDEGKLLTREPPPHVERVIENGSLDSLQGHAEHSGVEDIKTEAPRQDDAQVRGALYSVGEEKSWNWGSPVVRRQPPYVGGKFDYRLPIMPLYGGKFWNGKKFLPSQPQQSTTDADTTPLPESPNSSDFAFYQNLHIIANTQSVSEAWEAYVVVLRASFPESHGGNLKIPFQHLHRLCRLFSRTRPKTRKRFLQFLSVMYTLRRTGGTIHPHEWNALMSNAGGGWRRARPEEFKLAFNVFHEMTLGLSPGSTFSPSDYPNIGDPQPVQPDIYSYNILISIAAKTLYRPTVERASDVIRASGLSPDRITHLALLTYFSRTMNLSAVRSTLRKMQEQGLELGVDGVNSCLWAYNVAGRMDIVKTIYQVLKHNSISDPRLRNNSDSDGIADALRKLEAEGIVITEQMRPDEITFTEVIQALAYRGDLHAAINVFLEMLSSDNIEVGAPLVRGDDDALHYTKYSPTYAIFRSLFLGFARHGTPDSTSQTWILDNLREIYRDFMTFPALVSPSPLLLYWILRAFDMTSGHDVELIREIWLEMEGRFTYSWGGRLGKLRTIIFSEDSYSHLETIGFRVTPEEKVPRRDLDRYTEQEWE